MEISKLKIGTDEECCGACRSFSNECTDGDGHCDKHNCKSYCGLVCNEFEPRKEE